MKSAKISVCQKVPPLEHRNWLSTGRPKLERDDGIAGRGEGMPRGHSHAPAHGPGIRAGIGTVAPVVLGPDPRKVPTVERATDLARPGHLCAAAPTANIGVAP